MRAARIFTAAAVIIAGANAANANDKQRAANAKQQAKQAGPPAAGGAVPMQVFRIGCVKPEPDEVPKSAKGADACAGACIDDNAPYFALADDGSCSCTMSYDAAAVGDVPANGACGDGKRLAHAWSTCLLGAQLGGVKSKKGYWQGEVRLGTWMLGSSLRLHWGRTHAKFMSVWHADKLVDDAFVAWQDGGDWDFRLMKAPPGETYTYLGLKVSDPPRVPSLSCRAALPPPAPPAPPPPPMPPPICTRGVAFEIVPGSVRANTFRARVLFSAPWGRGGFALAMDFGDRAVRLTKACG